MVSACGLNWSIDSHRWPKLAPVDIPFRPCAPQLLPAEAADEDSMSRDRCRASNETLTNASSSLPSFLLLLACSHASVGGWLGLLSSERAMEATRQLQQSGAARCRLRTSSYPSLSLKRCWLAAWLPPCRPGLRFLLPADVSRNSVAAEPAHRVWEASRAQPVALQHSRTGSNVQSLAFATPSLVRTSLSLGVAGLAWLRLTARRLHVRPQQQPAHSRRRRWEHG